MRFWSCGARVNPSENLDFRGWFALCHLCCFHVVFMFPIDQLDTLDDSCCAIEVPHQGRPLSCQNVCRYPIHAYDLPDFPALVSHDFMWGSVSFSFRFPMEFNPQDLDDFQSFTVEPTEKSCCSGWAWRSKLLSWYPGLSPVNCSRALKNHSLCPEELNV